jgi:hypothetical protein
VGLLAATSGLLLIVGPAVLATLAAQAEHRLPLIERDRLVPNAIWNILEDNWLTWLVYHIVVLALAAGMMWLRQRKTVIYNIDPAALDTVFARTLARLGIAWTRTGNRVYLGFGAEPVSQEVVGAGDDRITAIPSQAIATGTRPPRTVISNDVVILDMDAFAMMCNVTLTWQTGDGALRQEVEAELAKALAEIQTTDNAAGRWLLTLSTGMFGLMFLIAVVILAGVILLRR